MHKYPFAIRLTGFGPEERPRLANTLAKAPVDGPGYFCLLEDSLQDPDLTIANGNVNASEGGGIRFDDPDQNDNLFVNRCTIRDNHANGAGGVFIEIFAICGRVASSM